MRTDFDAHWDELAEEVLSGMKEWRFQHPKATLRQIEATLDEASNATLWGNWQDKAQRAIKATGRRAFSLQTVIQ